jgi:hypothetical protein
VANLKKAKRITGTARAKLAAELKRKYEAGASIRSLAEETGRSSGFVRRMLDEVGVARRSAHNPKMPSYPHGSRDDAHRLLDQVPANQIPAVLEHLREAAKLATREHGERKFRTVGIFDGEPDLAARTKDILRRELGNRDSKSA